MTDFRHFRDFCSFLRKWITLIYPLPLFSVVFLMLVAWKWRGTISKVTLKAILHPQEAFRQTI